MENYGIRENFRGPPKKGGDGRQEAGAAMEVYIENF
jgi:hypothetical protein